MKTSARQLVRGLEMEMEKLKGSERSVCARITARFITARDGQIRHKTREKPHDPPRIFGLASGRAGLFKNAVMSSSGRKRLLK